MNPIRLNEIKTALLRERDLGNVMDRFLHWTETDRDVFGPGSPVEGDPLLESVLTASSEKLIGRKCRICELRLFHLRTEGFKHGSAFLDGHPVIFLYFEDIRTGLAAAPRLGLRPTTELVRFQAFPMTPGWVPAHN